MHRCPNCYPGAIAPPCNPHLGHIRVIHCRTHRSEHHRRHHHGRHRTRL